MKSKSTYKIITVFAISILFLSFNPGISVQAKFDERDNEGIWSDDFTDEAGLESNKCFYLSDEDVFELAKSDEPRSLDYNNYPNNVNVWYNDITIIDTPIGQIISALIRPDLLPGTEANVEEKVSVGQLDVETLKTEGLQLFADPKDKSYPLHHFQFKIDQEKDDLKNVRLKWWFGPYDEKANLEEISLYIWSYNSLIPSWGDKETISYDVSKIGGEDPDLSKTLDFNECLSDEGYIDVIIIGTPVRNSNPYCYLHTDYINVSLTSREGYVSEGTVTSEEVEPETLGRWDRIIWEESTPALTNITIQVLYENGDLIEGYESKNSPLDISSIDENVIKIRAILRSKSIDKTPKLKSWAVLFYKEDSYTDSFEDTYRVDESKGLTISSGKVGISSYFSDWPIFGKNPDNTRSYSGKTLSKPDECHWYSEMDGVGGRFRSPVVYDGKVYIGSYDKRIYAFNEKADGEGEQQDYIDSSSAKYFIDSSLAVSEEYVVFGTSELGKNNKIYFLDKDNLSREIFEYSPVNGPICFSSAPVVDNDNIFITSWSGRIWDIPLTSILNQFIGGNNKLIGIDTNGEPLWDKINLPAGSFSTPAVGEGKVFVGCQNMWGKNLLAYDIDTGEKIWNITVGKPYGVIGRSSPVYADGKIFILCNEKKEILSRGVNKLYAVDASTGDILWNNSIGESIISSIFNLQLGIYNYAPVSTPAFYDKTLYVLSPSGNFYAFNSSSGDERWSVDFANESILPGLYTASPLIVGDNIYIVTTIRDIVTKIHCFDVKQGSFGVEKWSYEIEQPEESKYLPQLPADIIASPVIADGLMFLSSTENYTNFTGRVYCFGDYEPNDYGFLESTPIYLPKSHWWDTFSSEIEDTTENNTVSIDILNKYGDTISGFSNLNGSEISLTNLTSNAIRLYAEFNIGNHDEAHPSLKSWMLDWVPEEGVPVFNNTDTGGWINEDLGDCSVTAIDQADDGILSGIDVNSAKYKLSYIPKGKTNPVDSDWIDAECSDNISGVKETTVTAKISDSGLNIEDLLNITFRISDLAGNIATSEELALKTDTETPSSYIKNKDTLESMRYHNKVFNISADASDAGESGIRKTILKYRYSDSQDGLWDSWVDYKVSTSYFIWEFGLDEDDDPLKSGWYQIVTVAFDKAGNEEEITDDKTVEIFYDNINPSIDTDLSKVYRSREVPVFNFDISDDFRLDSLYYRPDSKTSWSLVDDYKDIGKKTESITWSFSDSYWAEMNQSEEHTIYLKVTDFSGNEYITTQENSPVIKKDANASRYIDISDFSEWHWGNTFTIRLKDIEDIDVKMVKLYYKYSEDKENYSEKWTQYGINKSVIPIEWDFIPPENDGYYKFYLQIEDSSGKIHTSSVEEVKITIFPLLETALFSLLIVIFLVTSILIIRRLKSYKNL